MLSLVTNQLIRNSVSFSYFPPFFPSSAGRMSSCNIKRNLERHKLANPPRDVIHTRRVQVSLLLGLASLQTSRWTFPCFLAFQQWDGPLLPTPESQLFILVSIYPPGGRADADGCPLAGSDYAFSMAALQQGFGGLLHAYNWIASGGSPIFSIPRPLHTAPRPRCWLFLWYLSVPRHEQPLGC